MMAKADEAYEPFRLHPQDHIFRLEATCALASRLLRFLCGKCKQPMPKPSYKIDVMLVWEAPARDEQAKDERFQNLKHLPFNCLILYLCRNNAQIVGMRDVLKRRLKRV